MLAMRKVYDFCTTELNHDASVHTPGKTTSNSTLTNEVSSSLC